MIERAAAGLEIVKKCEYGTERKCLMVVVAAAAAAVVDVEEKSQVFQL